MSIQRYNDDEYFLTTRPGPELQPLTEEMIREQYQGPIPVQIDLFDTEEQLDIFEENGYDF